MPASTVTAAAVETREERIEGIIKELRPKIDETVRQMVDRAVDVPEAAEFGASDIGSGPAEAGCKIIGERLRGSGIRWVENGAVTVASLRALYVSSGKLWDGFWLQSRRQAA